MSRAADALKDCGPFGAAAPTAPAPKPPTKRCTATAAAPSSAPDWSAIRAEGAELGPGMFGLLLAVDARIVSVASNPPMSPWWRETFSDWYASGKFSLVCLVGRGGGKSTTLGRVALTETLLGSRIVPAGQRFLWPFVSVSIADARQRIHELATAARALGLEAEPSYPSNQPTLELVDAHGQDVALVALASNVRATSGKTSVGATIDEEGKLQGPDGANPSAEVIASAIQTFRSSPHARLIRCSSAWAKGTHSAAVDAGSTEFSHVATVGAEFLLEAVSGFLRVAAWEEAHGNPQAAERLRRHASALTADDRRVPSWVANPQIDPVRAREQIESMKTPDGLAPTDVWLRELGSVMPDVSGSAAGQLDGLADAVRRVQAAGRTERGEPTLYGNRPDPLAACFGVTRPERSLVPLRHRRLL